MKLIVSLSSFALFSLSSISPCLATNQTISRLSEQSLLEQSLPGQPEPIKVAGLSLGDVMNTVRQGMDLINDERDRQVQRANDERDRQVQRAADERAAQERQAQEAAAAQRQQELEASERAAAEQQQAAAEQRRQAFENLSPAQKEAYMAQQQAEQDAMWTFLRTLLMGGSSSASPSQSDQSDLVQDELQRQQEDRYNNPPEPEPAPAPVEPIDPFYGSGPGGSFYGH